MKIEIERKFLVDQKSWQAPPGGVRYRQGYLCTDPQRTVRVRVGGDTAILAVKGESTGLARAEFEFPIPLEDAQALLERCLQPVIDKIRYRLTYAGLTWEVDEFLGANRGLLLAEVELDAIDQPVSLPPWAGAEVSTDPRYYNAYLSRHPYTTWDRTAPPGRP
jgi:CYTH domain-containing protein